MASTRREFIGQAGRMITGIAAGGLICPSLSTISGKPIFRDKRSSYPSRKTDADLVILGGILDLIFPHPGRDLFLA